jgi:hypothetical protein
MQRPLIALLLAVLLAVAAGIIWFAWSAHDFGSGCGERLPGYPRGPTLGAAILFGAVSAAAVAALRAWQKGSAIQVVGFAALTAVLVAIAVVAAWLELAISRNCFE